MANQWMAAMIALGMFVGIAAGEPVRMRTPTGEIRSVPEESVPAALKQGYTSIPKVLMRTPDGLVVAVDEDDTTARERAGYWRMTAEEIQQWDEEQAIRRRHTAQPERRSVRMRGPEGQTVDVAESDVAYYESLGFSPLSIQQEVREGQSEARPEEHDDWRETVSLWALVGIMFSIVGYIMVRGRSG